jgi:8-oxo-dGTP pyrophosphatase MutT (NUDIX family)
MRNRWTPGSTLAAVAARPGVTNVGFAGAEPMTDLPVVPVERLEFRLAPRPWPFAEQRRAEIDAYFARLKRDRPALWNGRVLLLHEWSLADGLLRGAFLETDFASYIAWRDWGFPDAAVTNCFAQAALRAADGAYLLGVMGAHTAGAGTIYFPSGTPDPGDANNGTVDLERGVMRELTEETGLTRDDVTVRPGWHAVLVGPRIALMKAMDSTKPAAALHSHIADYLRSQATPELADIRIVRGVADLDPKMPRFITAYLTAMWT